MIDAALNLVCLKSEYPIIFWVTSVLACLGIATFIFSLFKAGSSIIKYKNKKVLHVKGPVIFAIIGLALFASPFAVSYISIKPKSISFDARTVKWTIGDLHKEVVSGYSSSPPSGKIIIDSSVKDVQVQGYFYGDCAADFFIRLCNNTDEIKCSESDLFSSANYVHIKKR